MSYLIAQIERFAPKYKHAGGQSPLKVIAMIENARGMMELKEIIQAGKGYIDGLLVSLPWPGCVWANVSLRPKIVGRIFGNQSDAGEPARCLTSRLCRCRVDQDTLTVRDVVSPVSNRHGRQSLRTASNRFGESSYRFSFGT